MNLVEVIQGSKPIVLAQPHSGTYLPNDVAANLNELGKQLLDTDWHVPELYDGLIEDVTIVRANFSRYLVDPNRDPSGTSLYPGQNTTALVPLSSFDGKAIWKKEPSSLEIQQRCEQYHRVYHLALAQEIQRLRSLHGAVVVYDCHSIRSKIPYLFEARLPDLNIGDNSGRSCATQISDCVERACQNAPHHSYVRNGRFKGGWTTRHYGQPAHGVHAIQMELAQRTYLTSELPPFSYDAKKASSLRDLLASILHQINDTILNQSFS